MLSRQFLAQHTFLMQPGRSVASDIWVVPETGEIAFNVGFSMLLYHIEEARSEGRQFYIYACEHHGI